jgi:hypothetical protein
MWIAFFDFTSKLTWQEKTPATSVQLNDN